MDASPDRPAFPAVPEARGPLHPHPIEMFQGFPADDVRGPPVDLPDEFRGVIPEFRSRRKAEALPKLRPAEGAKVFDQVAWHRGFRCGVLASVCGMLIGIAALVVLP